MKRALSLFALLAGLMLSSCGDNGSWEPIKMTENMLEVPAGGGIVTTRLLNYPIVEILGLVRDGQSVAPINSTPYMLETTYLKAVLENRILTITVNATRDTTAHTFALETQNGNAFYTVVVKQAAYKGE